MSTPDQVTARGVSDAGQAIAMAAVALHTAVSQAMGLHPSEGLCLWHVAESAYGATAGDGPVTAGRLADVTGLTTGAITGIIDRLEAAGLVRRERDPGDRRRVLIRPVPDGVAGLAELFEPMERAFIGLAMRYRPDQQAVILEYLRESLSLLNDQIDRLRARRSSPRRDAGGVSRPSRRA